MRSLIPIAALALASCSAEPTTHSGPPLDPIAFFAGRNHGDAVLRQVGSGERKVRVISVGTPQRDGSLILDQRITIAGGPPRVRRWVMRRIAPGQYSGTLTDAVGPFTAAQVGGRLRIRYTMKGGLKVEQWLVPLPGRNALDNRLTVTKWGVRVAFLRETIVKRP